MPFRCSSNRSIPHFLARGASDAALTPYQVDRSKLFAFERLEKTPNIDAVRIAKAIEMTRFPVPRDARGASERLEPKLVQAADYSAARRSAVRAQS
jgi:hypothetical protein